MKLKHKLAYMKCAESFAECSSANRLKVGSVIVKDNNIIACGYNALPKHIDGDVETKTVYTEPDGRIRVEYKTKPELRHSEKNALMSLIRSTNTAIGASLFCTHSCCKLCAIDIVDAGILEFYYKHDYRDDSGLLYLIDKGIQVVRL